METVFWRFLLRLGIRKRKKNTSNNDVVKNGFLSSPGSKYNGLNGNPGESARSFLVDLTIAKICISFVIKDIII